jgi:hypothetical protein
MPLYQRSKNGSWKQSVAAKLPAKSAASAMGRRAAGVGAGSCGLAADMPRVMAPFDANCGQP